MNNIRKYLNLNFLIYLSPVFVILAQIPYLRDNPISKVMSLFGVILVFLYIIFKNIKMNFKPIIDIIIVFLFIWCYVLFCLF